MPKRSRSRGRRGEQAALARGIAAAMKVLDEGAGGPAARRAGLDAIAAVNSLDAPARERAVEAFNHFLLAAGVGSVCTAPSHASKKK